MIPIDITTTATIRPRILRVTLRSFVRNLFRDHDCRLILNVDPIGQPEFKQDDVIDVARSFFPNRLLWRAPDTANFPLAMKWCWQNVESEFFFNLEDDWRLVTRLDLRKMLKIMRDDPTIATIRLPKGPSTEETCDVYCVDRIPHYVWNGSYFAPGPHTRSGYSGAPSLIRTSWMRGIVGRLSETMNHERIFRGLARRGTPEVLGWKYVVYTNPDTELTIMDIGRAWRQKHGFQRNSGTNLTGWTAEVANE